MPANVRGVMLGEPVDGTPPECRIAQAYDAWLAAWRRPPCCCATEYPRRCARRNDASFCDDAEIGRAHV